MAFRFKMTVRVDFLFLKNQDGGQDFSTLKNLVSGKDYDKKRRDGCGSAYS
jgi:hypothetical protein